LATSSPIKISASSSMEHLQRDQTGLRDYSSPATGRHYEAIRPGGHAVLPSVAAKRCEINMAIFSRAATTRAGCVVRDDRAATATPVGLTCRAFSSRLSRYTYSPLGYRAPAPKVLL
jgi:hypothetical protein